jgi:hypothetical protein
LGGSASGGNTRKRATSPTESACEIFVFGAEARSMFRARAHATSARWTSALRFGANATCATCLASSFDVTTPSRSDALDLRLQLRARHAAHGSAPALALIERLDARAKRRLGGPLQVQVERGLDAQTALQHGLAAELLEEVAAHFFREPGRGGEVCVLGRDAEHWKLGDRGLVGGLVDEADGDHAAQHILAPIVGRSVVAERGETRRRLRQSRQHRALRHGELADLLAEVGARRFADSPRTPAEIDLVQVEREDLVLAEVLLESPREDHLLHLAIEASLG